MIERRTAMVSSNNRSTGMRATFLDKGREKTVSLRWQEGYRQGDKIRIVKDISMGWCPAGADK